MVQVAKDPMGTKGARLTSYVSLPGRHLVYMPTVDHIGVSRKIERETERRRLRKFVEEMHKETGGFIVRTAAGGQSDAKLESDIRYLERLWKKILGRRQGMKPPSMLHKDLGLVQRCVRDMFTDDVDKLIVDTSQAYREIRQFVGQFLPKGSYNIELYKGRKPVFDHYGVEQQISRALAHKVWLKSGGYFHRCEHGSFRRIQEFGRNHPAKQPGSREGNRVSTSPTQYRRSYHFGLHRYGKEVSSQ